MSTAAKPDRPSSASVRGVYLLTHPRSASNLFFTMMSKQPNYQNSGYKLFEIGWPAWKKMKNGPLSSFPEEERTALYNGFRAAYQELMAELEDAKSNGKQVFIKEHTIFMSGPDKLFAAGYKDDHVEPLVLEGDLRHTNPSSVPDDLLLSMQPIFQIRHPVLMFPSFVRVANKAVESIRPRDAILASMLTLRHSRDMYDWYLSHGGDIVPKVIDADDIMNDRAAVRKLCEETGLDPDAVQYEWETKEEPNPMKKVFLSTINASKGILPGLTAKDLDIETEKAKWKVEFGDEDGEDLAKCVYDAMPDYNYLLSRRVCSQP